MCRWITLISNESVSLSDVVLAPSNSLVQLSRDASFHPEYGVVNNAIMNGDGFGVGWYHCNEAYFKLSETASHDGGLSIPATTTTTEEDDQATHESTSPFANSARQKYQECAKAAMFKDIQPAWNNTNLREICLATRSNCIMAHVRAASKGMGISQQNCHPFKAGRLLFCHNGRLHQFAQYRRKFLQQVANEVYGNIYGNTDSEIVFHFILTNLMASTPMNDVLNDLPKATPLQPKGNVLE